AASSTHCLSLHDALPISQLLGFKMVGVVPQTISRGKDQKLQDLGVQLIKVAGGSDELLDTAQATAERRAAYFVHPHLDPLWTDRSEEHTSELQSRFDLVC